MDCFQVTKVVNRHVLKAIYQYSEQLFQDSIALSTIKLEVSYSMKNVNPIQDLDSLIESSVENLTLIGVLKETALNGSDEKWVDFTSLYGDLLDLRLLLTIRKVKS
ncbi:uncharacterized protein LOC111073225 [Drosophila obscura]|uniref:uncharacterized protein LOC111073225 n=1 Tax=Drosophila obscura TaxID=7282 RepID=UPI001BB16B63|nr:uncharacterized protein LOC111073225 [Drosophila obscura]